MKKTNFILLLFLIFPIFLISSQSSKCIYINSYHKGYVWSDIISKEINTILKDECEIVQFNMNTKIEKKEENIKEKALEAKKLIEQIKPRIVISSDDNAAKYIIKPYFKDSKIPFVFCGINWTAKEYGFPYKNVTGIIEVNPIKELYKTAIELSHGKKAIFIGDDTITERKSLIYLMKYAKKNNIILDSFLVTNVTSWKNKYLMAQEEYDFIILGHNSSIKNFNQKHIKEFLLKNSKKIVFATYDWMMPYSMIGLLIDPKEQGEWAATTAKAILNGYPISDIEITTNKTWKTVINKELLEASNIKLPREVLIKSKLYERE